MISGDLRLLEGYHDVIQLTCLLIVSTIKSAKIIFIYLVSGIILSNIFLLVKEKNLSLQKDYISCHGIALKLYHVYVLLSYHPNRKIVSY